jgi:GH15 family glucan-1,4-alpha-glucosidase
VITDAARVSLAARGWVADGVRGALVAADGTVDWYCPGGFASPPACWRLLDPSGGAVRVGPVRAGTRVGPAPSSQAYWPGTNVLETVMGDGSGRRLSVVDVLPWSGPGLTTPGRLVRIVSARTGPIDVEVEVIPAGPWRPARHVSAFEGGLVVDELVVRTGFPLRFEPLGRDAPRWRATRRLDAGETFVVVLDEVTRIRDAPPLSDGAARRLAADTASAWRSWAAALVYDGPYGAAVERAALAVRSLTGPGGAPLAAGTTSLPRRVGSERTSDDRGVRWSDAAAAVEAWAATGFNEDAEAAEGWLRLAVAGAPRPWPPALDADGQPRPEPEVLGGVSGWRRSGPVIVGHSSAVVDLDAYGSVVAAYGASTGGPAGAGGAGPLSAGWPDLAASTDWLADHWGRPDAGIWESAGPPAVLVASRVQAWYALDRMARLARAVNPLDLAAVGWQQEARTLLAWLEADGISPGGWLRRAGALPVESGTGGSGTDDGPDAALLRLAWRGPWPAAHPVVSATVDQVLEQLTWGGLLFRYPERVDDGRAGPDSPDLLASAWAVRALAALGRWEEAHRRMEVVLASGAAGGGLGLLSQAADPVSSELMGNLPSAGVHLAVMQAAVALAAGPA